MFKIKFDESSLFPQCVKMADFYEKTGVFKYTRQGVGNDVKYIWMNHKQNHRLNDAMKENVLRSNEFKCFTDEYRTNIVAWDWLNYAPTSKEFVPNNEIWIFEGETDLMQYDNKKSF